MKWFYRECDVEITAVYDTAAKVMFTPTVEIMCKAVAKPHILTTKDTFKSAVEAELHGALIARAWIDENV